MQQQPDLRTSRASEQTKDCAIFSRAGRPVRRAVHAFAAAAAAAFDSEDDVLIVRVAITLEPECLVDTHVGRVHRPIAASTGQFALIAREEVRHVSVGPERVSASVTVSSRFGNSVDSGRWGAGWWLQCSTVMIGSIVDITTSFAAKVTPCNEVPIMATSPVTSRSSCSMAMQPSLIELSTL